MYGKHGPVSCIPTLICYSVIRSTCSTTSCKWSWTYLKYHFHSQSTIVEARFGKKALLAKSTPLLLFDWYADVIWMFRCLISSESVSFSSSRRPLWPTSWLAVTRSKMHSVFTRPFSQSSMDGTRCLFRSLIGSYEIKTCLLIRF